MLVVVLFGLYMQFFFAVWLLYYKAFLLWTVLSDWCASVVSMVRFSLCVPGAIGDVDGDGTLDLISIVSFSADITDESRRYLRTQKMTRISKQNLELQLMRPVPDDFVRLNSSRPDTPQQQQQQQLSGLRFRPFDHQPWTAYLGTRGDSSYTANWVIFRRWHLSVGPTVFHGKFCQILRAGSRNSAAHRGLPLMSKLSSMPFVNFSYWRLALR